MKGLESRAEARFQSTLVRRKKRSFIFSRSRCEEIQPQLFGEELGREPAFDAVSGVVERRGESAEPALSGGDGDHPAADAALAGQPDLIQPITGILVEPSGNHDGQDVLAVDGVNDPLLGKRVHSSVGQGGSHDRHILGSHVQRALFGVNVGGLERIKVDPVVALEQAGDALVPLVGSCLRLIHLAVKGKASSGELG
jgi:hypothetical protein